MRGGRRRSAIGLALVLGLCAPYLPLRAQAADFASLCPDAVDARPDLPQPQVSRFQFTGTGQVFSRLAAGSSVPVKRSMNLIGCYAAFPEVLQISDLGWQIGSISRDGQGFYWQNAAGVRWGLTLDTSGEFLVTDASAPYREIGDRFDLSPVIFRRDGALGQSPDLTLDVSRRAWVGTDPFPLPIRAYSYGFSWYSLVWPLFTQVNRDMNAAAGVSWIYPRVDELTWDQQRALCSPRPYDMQSMEGGLGWVASQSRFPTLLPKHKFNPVPDCYQSDGASTPGWDLSGRQVISRPTVIAISNHLLMAPDGFVFAEESAGGMLGSATMAIPMSELIPMNSRSALGDQAWLTFFNTSNFKGPVALYPPQMWAAFTARDPRRVKFGLDRNGAYVPAAAMEWGGFPYMEYQDANGVAYSRVPKMQMPVDAQGRTIIMSDFKAYSKEAFFAPFAGKEQIPFRFIDAASTQLPATVSKIDFYQNGKAIDFFSGATLKAFDGGRSYGFQWTQKSTVVSLPEVFGERGGKMVAITSDQAPKALRDKSFSRTVIDAHEYAPPTFWPSYSDADVQRALLGDGSEVAYVWVRFVDQPGVQLLGLSPEEQERLQALATKMHQAWSDNPDFMAPPSAYELATMDPALVVRPPKGKEFGFIPLVVGQRGGGPVPSSTSLLELPKSAFQREIKRTPSGDVTVKRTIVCLKGKIVKRVTAIRPKCPKGYTVRR